MESLPTPQASTCRRVQEAHCLSSSPLWGSDWEVWARRDPPLLPKLWADLALMEVRCSWWGQDVLSPQREWRLSSSSEVVRERPERQVKKKGKKRKRQSRIGNINLLFFIILVPGFCSLQALSHIHPQEGEWIKGCWEKLPSLVNDPTWPTSHNMEVFHRFILALDIWQELWKNILFCRQFGWWLNGFDFYLEFLGDNQDWWGKTHAVTLFVQKMVPKPFVFLAFKCIFAVKSIINLYFTIHATVKLIMCFLANVSETIWPKCIFTDDRWSHSEESNQV